MYDYSWFFLSYQLKPNTVTACSALPTCNCVQCIAVHCSPVEAEAADGGSCEAAGLVLRWLSRHRCWELYTSLDFSCPVSTQNAASGQCSLYVTCVIHELLCHLCHTWASMSLALYMPLRHLCHTWASISPASYMSFHVTCVIHEFPFHLRHTWASTSLASYMSLYVTCVIHELPCHLCHTWASMSPASYMSFYVTCVIHEFPCHLRHTWASTAPVSYMSFHVTCVIHEPLRHLRHAWASTSPVSYMSLCHPKAVMIYVS